MRIALCLSLGLVLGLWACRPSEEVVGGAVVWRQSSFEGKVHRLHYHLDTLWLAQGLPFGGGQVVFSVDEGQTWEAKLIRPHELRDLLPLADGRWGAVGRNNLAWLLSSSRLGWETFYFEGWDLWQSLAFHPNWGWCFAGGINFSQGQLLKMDDAGNLLRRDSVPHEIKRLHWQVGGRLWAVGYGLVMFSDDGGERWQQTAIRGDFFQDIVFLDARRAWVVGLYGSLWETSDGGASWQRRQRGRTWGEGGRYRALHFRDAEHGLLVGPRGGVWRTRDGGQTWQKLSLEREVDWYSVSYGAGRWWLGGAGGWVLTLAD